MNHPLCIHVRLSSSTATEPAHDWSRASCAGSRRWSGGLHRDASLRPPPKGNSLPRSGTHRILLALRQGPAIVDLLRLAGVSSSSSTEPLKPVDRAKEKGSDKVELRLGKVRRQCEPRLLDLSKLPDVALELVPPHQLEFPERLLHSVGAETEVGAGMGKERASDLDIKGWHLVHGLVDPAFANYQSRQVFGVHPLRGLDGAAPLAP